MQAERNLVLFLQIKFCTSPNASIILASDFIWFDLFALFRNAGGCDRTRNVTVAALQAAGATSSRIGANKVVIFSKLTLLMFFRQEKINAEKNATPLVKKARLNVTFIIWISNRNFSSESYVTVWKPKKAPITKQLTKEETKRMVANASSATERAKALLASGKLKIEQKQR